MEFLKSLASNQFFWGFCLGFLFFAISFVSHQKTKGEFRRFQRHLSDKLELEAKQYEAAKTTSEELKKENENLRLKIGQLNDRPDSKLQRDVEIMVRAEKRMMIAAPGFAPAWETAKNDAVRELEAEERGKSIPKRLFTRLFGTGGDGYKDAEAQHLLEEPSHPNGDKAAHAGTSDNAPKESSSSAA